MKTLHFTTSVCYLAIVLMLIQLNGHAQTPAKPSAGKVLQDLKRLNVLGNVLYLAAHPDDENTTLIAYMANQKLYHTGYLALTRGDGGQNLIGPEIRERLGVIRTQELLQARRTDGGYQFFTRANDFGFSKNPEEVFSIWNREKLLADVVWVIRNFKPDVIITRFPKDSRAGHGQHSASSILAEDAFVAAADPKRFPEQLKYVQVWQAKRLLWNISSWAFKDPKEFDKIAPGLIKVDVGVYNPLFGKSYGEISAESRSMHKSQGFGSTGSRGTSIDYFQHTLGSKAKADLFEGINTSWARVKNSTKVEQSISKAISSFNAANPAAVVPQLLAARAELEKLPEGFWKQRKMEEIQDVIKEATGLYMEATAGSFAVTPGQPLSVKVEVINRSAVPVQIKSVAFPFRTADSVVNTTLGNSADKEYTATVKVPEDLAFSQPYWLEKKDSLGLFFIKNQKDVGLPENKAPASVTLNMTMAGQQLSYTIPVLYKHNDPVNGELFQPLAVSPPAFANIAENVYMFAGKEPKQVTVFVKAGRPHVKGTVSLKLPAGWRVEPAEANFGIEAEEAEQTVNFNVFPPAEADEAELQALITIDGKTYNKGLKTINYNHIPVQTLFPDATAKVVKLDLVKKGRRIGYLMGAGDDVPRALQQIGYEVSLLTDADINPETLNSFDAVILGVRSYNTIERIRVYHDKLMDYVKNGGNLIVQYNTNGGLKMNPGPFPMKLSTDRVTVEGAEVRFLLPDHAVLNTPNRITAKDFDGWVQERGLYFPSEWSSEYQAIISSNDPGGPPLNSSLLIAKYGKGNFIYTGLSMFRELPAGVPGAYRLFTNLISLGK